MISGLNASAAHSSSPHSNQSPLRKPNLTHYNRDGAHHVLYTRPRCRCCSYPEYVSSCFSCSVLSVDGVFVFVVVVGSVAAPPLKLTAPPAHRPTAPATPTVARREPEPVLLTAAAAAYASAA